MKVVALRNSVHFGPHHAHRGQVTEVPDSVAKNWISAGYVMPADVAPAIQEPPSQPAKAPTRAKRV